MSATRTRVTDRWPNGSAVAVDTFDGNIVEVCEPSNKGGGLPSVWVFDWSWREPGLIALNIDHLEPLTPLARRLLRMAGERP